MSDPAPPSAAESALHSPYLASLQDAVAQLYAVFGTGPLSRDLESCACPVCMTEETRQQIIATPTDALSADLIAAYSNSAHGVPRNLDDLRALLPRYLDLIAQDEMVDHVGVGAELVRFGDALRMDGSLYTSVQQQALNTWGHRAVLHFGYVEATEQDNLTSPAHLFEMLLAGGWPVAELTRALDDLFAQAEIGMPSVRQFGGMASRALIEKPACYGLDWFALRYVDNEACAGLADWLNSESFRSALHRATLDPSITEDTKAALATLLQASGQFAADAFPKDRYT